MAWRLGLDVGTNSIGWAAIRLGDGNGQPCGLLKSGVRIASDGRNPKDKQSLAVARRGPRQQRKRRDRYLKRRAKFMQVLIAYSLMPNEITKRKDLETLDPWAFRVKGLDEKLALYELGRALFHLQQRRGFKSNRKTDKGADDESGKIKIAANDVHQRMKETGVRTLGEFLAQERIADPKIAHEKTVRARLQGKGAKAFYDFYPTRDMIVSEFESLWSAQKEFHGDALGPDAHDEVLDILTFQRDLKPQPVGKCTLNPDEDRAATALPSVQRRRIFEEINHLRVRAPGQGERKLSLQERDVLVVKALSVGKVTFDAMRKLLKVSDLDTFSSESNKRKHLDGDKTAAILAAAKHWGKAWRDLPLETQDQIVTRLLNEEDEQVLCAELVQEYGLGEDMAQAVAKASLPDGHGQLGITATQKVLAELEKSVITYDKAVKAAGYHSHSQLDFEADGEIFDHLPYYGEVMERHVAFGSGKPGDPLEKRVGKIANPTVHVVLNQIRHVVNDLIKAFGPPAQIVVELARDLPLSAKGKSELEKTQADNKTANDLRREELKKLNLPDTYGNRLRLRLWEELNPADIKDRRCPFTGEKISIQRLFSDAVEIEHILPFSQTLDDSPGNKTLSMRRANRFKGQKSPFEAFSQSPEDYDWSKIAERAALMPNNKSWRFGPDAMERYENEERDFLARQLTDTRYISRLTHMYLKRTGADVWVTPGRLTSDLRWTWGLNSILTGHNQEEAADPAKNRNDHRHHAIDAVVIGLTDRSLLQAVATAAGQAEVKFDKRFLSDLEDPWPNFRETVRKSMDDIIVSHKADHGVQGALHNDTAYGVVQADIGSGKSQVVHRVPLESLKTAEKLNLIRDICIREHLMAETQGLSGKDYIEALVAAGEAMTPPVRRVRIIERLSVIPIKDASGDVYKAYKGDGNYCYDIFVGEKGTWTGDVVNRFDANQKGFDPRGKISRTGKPLIMRIRGDDMLALENGGTRTIMRVVKFSDGQLVLAQHMEGGSLKARDKDQNDPFKYLSAAPSALQKRHARLVHVTPAGRVFDPGPHP